MFKMQSQNKIVKWQPPLATHIARSVYQLQNLLVPHSLPSARLKTFVSPRKM